MDFITVVLVFALLPNILLGLLSYSKGKKSGSAYAWTILIWTVILWITAMIIYRISSPQNSVFWCRILYIAAALIPVPFLSFSFLFPEETWPIRKIYKFLLFLPTLVIIFLVIRPEAVIRNVLIVPGEEKIIVWGPLYFLYAIYVASFFTWALWNIFRKFLKAKGITKKQISYVFLGTSISSIFGIAFNLILPWMGEFRFNWLGQVTTLFMIGAITYAIFRFHFMNIRVALTELLVAIIAIVLFTDIILAETVNQKLLRGSIFLVFCFFAYLLIKSVISEIERREELEKLNKAKSEFLSIASHQLRTPLTAIKGYASMILESTYGRLPEKAKPPIKNIFISTERLLKLVNDLLNLSRIESGKLEMQFSQTSLEELIREIISELEIKAKEKNLSIDFKKNSGLPLIIADKDKIRQTILNIIDNAIRYTDKGGIKIELMKDGEKIKIVIADTGEGISENEIDSLFESFARGKAGSKFWTDGAGLGLYTAKKFVEMHRGKIWAESEGKGRGSTFYIVLPIK